MFLHTIEGSDVPVFKSEVLPIIFHDGFHDGYFKVWKSFKIDKAYYTNQSLLSRGNKIKQVAHHVNDLHTSSNKIIRNDGKAVLTRSHNLKVRWIISKKRPKEYKQVSHLLPTNWFLIQANDCIPNPTWMWSLCRGNKQTDEICMWRKGIYMFLLTHPHVENDFPSSLSSSDESKGHLLLEEDDDLKHHCIAASIEHPPETNPDHQEELVCMSWHFTAPEQ